MSIYEKINQCNKNIAEIYAQIEMNERYQQKLEARKKFELQCLQQLNLQKLEELEKISKKLGTKLK